MPFSSVKGKERKKPSEFISEALPARCCRSLFFRRIFSPFWRTKNCKDEWRERSRRPLETTAKRHASALPLDLNFCPSSPARSPSRAPLLSALSRKCLFKTGAAAVHKVFFKSKTPQLAVSNARSRIKIFFNAVSFLWPRSEKHF